MNYIRIVGDGLVIFGLLLAIKLIGKGDDGTRSRVDKAKLKEYLMYSIGIMFSIIEVYFIYRHQENSDLFFWHPYLAWSLGNILFTILRRKTYTLRSLLMERVVLWQVIIVTVFAGLTLSVGWLMKLYIR